MAKKIEDDNKVMDVSKPGKGKIIMNSRPVVAPIVSNEVSADPGTASTSTAPEEEASEPLAPSASRRVIQPITSNIVVTDASSEESINVTSSVPNESGPAPAPPAPAEQAAQVEQAAPAEQAAETPKPQPAVSNSAVKESIPPSSEKPVPKPITPKPVAEKPKVEPQSNPESKPADSPASSDAAGVDAMAGAAEAKKLTAQEAEEQARRDAAVKELINSKKYIVPINHDSAKAKSGGKHHEWLMVIIILILAGLIAGYLLVDAGVISTSVELPYEFIKS